MATRTKAQGPKGPIDVDLSVSVLPEFLRKLARATRWDGPVEDFIDGQGQIVPGSPQGGSGSRSDGQFAVDYLWGELLSKFDDGKSSDDKERAAFAKFREAELLCGITNARLSRMVGLPGDLAISDLERTLCVARSKIRGILGKFSWDHAARGFGFSSGASTRLPKVRSSAPHKYSGTPETTYANSDLARACIMSLPTWKRSLALPGGSVDVCYVEGNRVTTVPKNYKTDRVIAIEPCMNMYVQKGLGSLIRERLRKVGINLNSQETNQDLALYGSATGGVATIDLSMASDTVSLELVRFLLPATWLAAFEQCRSAMGVLPSGEKILYRKFSSMGNGLTFELESLIFYGLSLAVCDLLGIGSSLVSVYGDDIVVPTAAASALIEVLEFAGFKTNEKKTFVSGRFRESCGKHYLAGQDVQPFYVRNHCKKLSDLFLLHNKLARWQKRQRWNLDLDHESLSDLRRWLRSHAPWNWRAPRIPDGYGDGAFIGTFDECTPRLADTYRPGKLGRRDGWSGYIAEVLVDQGVLSDFHEDGWGRYVIVDKTVTFKPALYAPTEVGRLLQSLCGVGRADETVFSTPFEGGVSQPPRPRLVKIIVDGFSTV